MQAGRTDKESIVASTVKERLVASTIELIATHGVAGTGISELLEHSKVSRRSVYLNFPQGKSELVAEATRTVGRRFGAALSGLTPGPMASAVVEFGGLYRGILESSGFAMGCPIVAATLGRDEAPDAADAARDTFAEWVQTLAARLRLDGVADAQCEPLATTIVAAVEGAVIMSIAMRSAQPLEQAVDQLAVLIRSAAS